MGIQQAILVSSIDEKIKRHEKYELNTQTVALIIASGFTGAFFTGIKPIITTERFVPLVFAVLFGLVFKLIGTVLDMIGSLLGG